MRSIRPTTGVSRRFSPRAGFLLLSAWAASVPAMAGFNEPVAVTESDGGATQVLLEHDPANNAYVVSIVDETLQVEVLGASSRLTFHVPDSTAAQGDPDIAVNFRGDIFLCYTQSDPDPLDTGREVYLTILSGGQFSTPRNLSDNRIDDAAPRLALDAFGKAHVIWAQSRGDGEDSSQVVYYEHQTGEVSPVARGAYPALTLDALGVAHVIYSRGNDLYYNHNRDGSFDAEKRLVNTPAEPEFDATIGVDERGNLAMAYESFGTLYFISRPAAGVFTPPRVLDRGGVLHPELRVFGDNALSIVYSKQGEIRYILGASTFLLEPEPVLSETTAAVESHPSLAVDACGTLHVAFLRGGETYYANNAGALAAEFTASPRDGEVPLRVEFQDLSSGKAQLWHWDFGDGTQANSTNPTHVYDEPGLYTVTLTAFGTDQQSVIEKRDFILVQEPFNTLEIPDQVVFPNQPEVWFPVIAGHREGIRGFQVMAVFDPNILTPTGCDLSFTETEDMRPEVWECNILERRFEVGCIFDFFAPFDHTTLPAGENHTLVNFLFDVSNRAPAGGVTEVQLVNNSEISRIFNIFSVDTRSRLPVLESSTVRVVPLDDPGFRLFIRGDTNGNGTLELTDAVQILIYLFRGGVDLPCHDAADVHDRGVLDISSAVGILKFLFTGAAAPRVPFPNYGLDPTEDTLPPCD